MHSFAPEAILSRVKMQTLAPEVIKFPVKLHTTMIAWAKKHVKNASKNAHGKTSPNSTLNEPRKNADFSARCSK